MVGHGLYGTANRMSWLKRLCNRIRMEIQYRRNLRRGRGEDPFIYF
jgi:hypothetical protein